MDPISGDPEEAWPSKFLAITLQVDLLKGSCLHSEAQRIVTAASQSIAELMPIIHKEEQDGTLQQASLVTGVRQSWGKASLIAKL